MYSRSDSFAHCSKARALFQNDDEVLEYMDDRDLNTPRASLHEQRGEYEDAAECFLREGDNLKAIELFMLNHRCYNSSPSLLKAARCVLDGFWLFLSLGAPEDNWHDQTVITLAAHAEHLQHRLPNGTLRDEVRALTTLRSPCHAEKKGRWPCFERLLRMTSQL